MPAHDWTRVSANIFHAFHVAWIGALQRQLNAGTLPKDYYALSEQSAGDVVPDVLTLHHASDPSAEGDYQGNGHACWSERIRKPIPACRAAGVR